MRREAGGAREGENRTHFSLHIFCMTRGEADRSVKDTCVLAHQVSLPTGTLLPVLFCYGYLNHILSAMATHTGLVFRLSRRKLSETKEQLS